MRVTLLHNPGAGDGDRPGGAELSSLLRAAGHAVRYQSCADETWPAVLDEPADLVAVAGGDGTVGRVAKKLIGRDIAVAPLPLGTANNIAKTLGLDELTLEEIIASWSIGRIVAFDAGIANGPWGSRYFVEAAGVGLFARAISAARRSSMLAALDTAEAKVGYARQMLREHLERCTPQRLEFTVDGEACSGEYVLFEAMNMEFVGPNLYLAPGVNPADGKLDLVLVTRGECDALRESLEHWDAGGLEHPGLTRRLGSTVSLEWSGFEVHVDDETWPDEKDATQRALNRIELTVEREALQFLTV